MELARILITIAVGLGWIIGGAIAAAQLDDHRLPQYPRPQEEQSLFWQFHLMDASRYRRSARPWLWLLWLSQLGPVVLLVLFVRWWG
jgi:hypothetical protein